MRECDLLTGPLEPTNRPYALAKIAGIEMCWSYNRQYGTRFLAAMPPRRQLPPHAQPRDPGTAAALSRSAAARRCGRHRVGQWAA